MWRILLVRHWVDHTFEPCVTVVGVNLFAPFNTKEIWGKPVIHKAGFLCKVQSTALQLLIWKTMEQWMHEVGLTLFEINSLGDSFWILMWSQRSENIFSRPCALPAHRDLIRWRKSVPELDLLTWIWYQGGLMEWINARDSELLLMWFPFFAHSWAYREVKLWWDRTNQSHACLPKEYFDIRVSCFLEESYMRRSIPFHVCLLNMTLRPAVG